MKKLEEARSILTLKQTVIDKALFERYSDAVDKIDEDGRITFHRTVKEMDKGAFKVTMNASLFSEQKYNIEVQISGVFSISEDSALGKKVLANNTAAILFPYLRSQLTLLTSQPGFEPVILPVMNINALMKDES